MSGARADSALVEVEGLCVAFGARRVVRDLSFRLARGATLALVGESGSGKSLSALSLLGLLPAGAAATRTASPRSTASTTPAATAR